MPAGNPLGVADPAADHMDGKILEQFGLPDRAQIPPHLRPGTQRSRLVEPDELGARVVSGPNESNDVSHFAWWPLGLDIVRSNRRRKADTHEESGERLRKVFKIRRTESPSLRKLLRMSGQVRDGQTVNDAEVDDIRGPFVVRCRGRREQVQAFNTALANAFPLTDFPKVRVHRFEVGERMVSV